MAMTHEIRRRRDEFFNCSLEEMVEKIIDLEAAVEDAQDEVTALEKRIAELEASAS